jgi:ABC-type nitrate/sulfonate/bicarbonate transport system substrate-binding protein
MDVDAEWQALTGSRLLVTTLAVWDDYAQRNPDDVRNLIRAYRAAADYIQRNPDVYVTTGFVKDSGLEETPAVLKLFQERFAPLYTAEWNQALVDANNKVFEQAIAMGNLEAIPPDWYTFEYVR